MPTINPPPIRVGFVVHLMQVAGAEVLVEETIRQLGSLIEPTIFCLDAVGAIGEQLQKEGVPVVCLDRKPKRDYGVAFRMAREVRQRGIQVVHAHQYTPFFYSALAKVINRNGFRLILTEHGRHYPDVVSSVRRAVNRLFLDRLADAVNACSAFSGEALTRHDGFRGNRIEVIENGIHIHRYEHGESRTVTLQKLGLDPRRKYITMVARFHPVKNHHMLLRAFHKVAQVYPDVDLLLAGDGPMGDFLRAKCDRLQIRDRVHFLGVRRDVPDLLRASDIFTLTSVTEAASLTLMEAMAASLPVVVTRVGGNPEIVREGIDGLMVPRNDDAACAQAFLELLRDPNRARKMGEAGHARVAEKYDLSRTIEQYHALYRRLLGRGK